MSREQQTTCGARHSMTGVFCELDARHAGNHFGEDSHARVSWPGEPTPPAEGPFAYTWREAKFTDKPHRLIYDLCSLLEQRGAVSPPPASGEVEKLLAEKDRQIETLTQALREALSFMPDVTAYQRERRRIVAAALAGASRPTEGEQGAKP